jgi:dihydroorotase
MQENLVKVNPPLRSEDDVKALWEGIADGTVDIVATDHAPHLLEEKRLPYPQAPSGVPGVQTMLPLLLNAVNQGKLSLQKVAELCAENPAKWFGIKQKGRIEAGFDADFAVVDLDLSHQVSGEFMFTKAHWSPFEGRVLKGWPVMTFVGGEKMFEWPDRFGKILGRPVEFV